MEKKEKTETAGIDKATRRIIRLLATDIDGDLNVMGAMRKIKGVNFMFANAVCNVMGIDKKKKVGELSQDELKSIEDFIKNPQIPGWLLNRRRDIETGKDMHMTSSDVPVSKKFDIQRKIDKKIYKGVRHMLGLPVRGQRTRSSFRRGKTVGVVRKAVRQQQSTKKK